jgi:hypothetical protein
MNGRDNRVMKRRRTFENSSPSGPPRLSSSNSETSVVIGAAPMDEEDVDLRTLLNLKRWEAAENRADTHPEEIASPKDPSPLALACRLGAPYSCVEKILKANPERLRHVLDSRGTPLHEAIVCDEVGPRVIELLLKTDDELGPNQPRAAILQDVDGYTALHLLIRRRFQSHVLGPDEGSHLMEILEMLVSSCAEAVVVPDRGEYEEPPIVMALKANVYAPLLQSEDATAARIERNIYEMVNCMLHHYPQAASCVFNGYRGQYTALHSAVFHGRCPDTIELLLRAEERCPASNKAALMGNTQGEMPLHFATMRGEPPRTVALLAAAAPESVLKRDASGLTPMHWLWIRFVSTVLALDDGGRGSDVTMDLENTGLQANDDSPKSYSAFTSLLQGNFEADLQLIRRLDPSVDFLRMRHIPVEILDEDDATQWAKRAVVLLEHIRNRHESSQLEALNNDGDCGVTTWTRIEAVTSLFWTKVVSLLEAAAVACNSSLSDDFLLVHSAFSAPCCLPPVARIVASLYPEEITMPDSKGRLPLHYAALREWHAWDWPREDGTSESANARLLRRESALVLKTAMVLSPKAAASHIDSNTCQPLHYVISSLVRACNLSGRSCVENPVEDMLEIIDSFLQMNPDSLQERHPTSALFPFMHASAVAAENRSYLSSGFSAPFPDELPLSIVYLLLRQSPSLVRTMHQT